MPTMPRFVEQQADTEMPGSDFIGAPVNTKDGQQVGRIAGLVFDRDGKIELAVIGVGGFLCLGEKVMAVPFAALKPETLDGKRVFAEGAGEDQLMAAPAFKTVSGAGGKAARQGQAAP